MTPKYFPLHSSNHQIPKKSEFVNNCHSFGHKSLYLSKKLCKYLFLANVKYNKMGFRKEREKDIIRLFDVFYNGLNRQD